MRNRKTEIKPSKEFERALAQCTPEDFDGHMEFHRLTPEQRLEWLSEAATFVYEFKGKARPEVSAQDKLLETEISPGLSEDRDCFVRTRMDVLVLG